MDKRQRIGLQRALVREALGKLRAAEEMFGIEDDAVSSDSSDYLTFNARVDDLERWIFEESSIA